jgi:lipopolysaccharide export system permease protein
MSILWRYALQNYLRVFSLSVGTFIAVLIIARFKEIARFTALTGELKTTGMFILYQVPSILPIAIPLSALISALLLFQALSRNFELTALRASGLSLRAILTPLLICSALLSILNFTICAEIAPFCRREGKAMIYHETSQNPLVLLQRQKLVKIKHAYLDMKVKDDETTKDLVLIVHNEANQHLSLLSARKLRIVGEELVGGDLSIVSYFNNDAVLIENQSSMSTAAPLLSLALKKNRPRLDIHSLSFKMLRLSQKKKPAFIEMLRRISLSLSVFTLTFLGCAFGIEGGRNPSRKNLFLALLLTLFLLMSYLVGQKMKGLPQVALLACFIPHLFLWFCSTLHLYRIARGRI